ncbi:uncharacterized protein TNCV_2395641 [Trichonephila clavipes]|nr:uncharacterized protein TNCV_2395641 [Trichonephila clavipes]
MVWVVFSYHGRSNLLRIKGNLNSNRYVREVLQPDDVPFLEGIPRAILQHHNALPHVAKLLETSVQPNTCNFFLGLLIRHLLNPCEIWLVRVPFVIRVLQLQKTNVCCAHTQYGILLHKQTIKICLTPCHVV